MKKKEDPLVIQEKNVTNKRKELTREYVSIKGETGYLMVRCVP